MHPSERSGHRPGQLGGRGLAACRFPEEEKGGQGFPGNGVVAEDRDHVVSQLPDLGGSPFL